MYLQNEYKSVVNMLNIFFQFLNKGLMEQQ